MDTHTETHTNKHTHTHTDFCIQDKTTPVCVLQRNETTNEWVDNNELSAL